MYWSSSVLGSGCVEGVIGWSSTIEVSEKLTLREDEMMSDSVIVWLLTGRRLRCWESNLFVVGRGEGVVASGFYLEMKVEDAFGLGIY